VTAAILAGVAIVMFVVLPAVAHLYTDLRWFRSVGFQNVFTTVLWTKIGLGLVVGLITAAVLYANLRVQDPSGQAQLVLGPLIPRLTLPAALLLGLVVGLSGAEYWDTWLKWVHASSFGETDPVFGYDVGFYVFELPALEAASSLALWLLGLSLVLSAGVYFARGGLSFTGRGIKAVRRVRVHLSVIGSLVFLVLAFEAWLAMPNLMFSDTGPVNGASYADVNAELPALRVLVGASIVAAVLVAVSATRTRIVLLLTAVGVYLAVDLLGVRLYPTLVQRFSVLPNEAGKEAPYIDHNIAATRSAFRLDGVTERELSTEVSLEWADIENNRATIENIRLWDHQPLLDTFAQIQEIRTYYEFESVDNDRYVIDGDLRQTMLSPRELKTESLPNPTWINKHFTFTHGYGITLGPVNIATEEGLPRLLIKDIPPVSDIESLDVTQPAIYFGELTNDYALVRTQNREFDYPSGEENVYAQYEGGAGIHLDSGLTRAAVAVRIGSFKLLLSDDVDEDSRILLYRNIKQRVRRIAPFLQFDRDPYMVVRDDGSLVWIQDAYTTSDSYPYAQPIHGLNYIRNSVKVVIDAYDGSVTFYVADEDDPILRTWQRIFPGTFTPLDEMPEDVRAHLRYPEDIFRIQTEQFTTYQMESAELVYNREDQWEIPSVRQGDGHTGVGEGGSQMVPYFTIMKLPGEDEAEFIQMIPFTPKQKQNLSAWMAARMDGDRLGELVVYRFPKDRLVFGPQQIMNRINQDAEIARQVSLWDQRGSEAVAAGNQARPRSPLYVSSRRRVRIGLSAGSR